MPRQQKVLLCCVDVISRCHYHFNFESLKWHLMLHDLYIQCGPCIDLVLCYVCYIYIYVYLLYDCAYSSRCLNICKFKLVILHYLKNTHICIYMYVCIYDNAVMRKVMSF